MVRMALILLMCVTTAGSTAGGAEGVDGGGASADTGAELLAYARERAALCAGAHCQDAVVVGFANMGYVPAKMHAANGTDLLACLAVSREVRARQRARHLALFALSSFSFTLAFTLSLSPPLSLSHTGAVRACCAEAGTASLRSTGCLACGTSASTTLCWLRSTSAPTPTFRAWESQAFTSPRWGLYIVKSSCNCGLVN